MLKKLKEQRGMTLIELLAVIVILAIISAIAIPSILGLINNSKKDAHVANARQMINSAKLAVSGDQSLQPVNNNSIYVSLQYLLDKGYIDTIKDPEGGNNKYEGGPAASSTSPTMPSSTQPTTGSYVKITADNNGKLSYSVYLIDDSSPAKTVSTSGGPVDESSLTRSNVSP